MLKGMIFKRFLGVKDKFVDECNVMGLFFLIFCVNVKFGFFKWINRKCEVMV